MCLRIMSSLRSGSGTASKDCSTRLNRLAYACSDTGLGYLPYPSVNTMLTCGQYIVDPAGNEVLTGVVVCGRRHRRRTSGRRVAVAKKKKGKKGKKKK